MMVNMAQIPDAIKRMMEPRAAFHRYTRRTPMQKLLLIAALSLGTFALARPMGSNMGDAHGADHDFYNQTVAAQAEHNSLFLAAHAISPPSPAHSEWWSGTHPSSMAANLTSPSADEDVYSETIAVQANVNRLNQAARQF
jgi:hypothetical protein